MKAILRTILAVVCIVTMAVCAALIFRKLAGRARVDLTERHIYTLSRGTRNILLKLNQPIKLKLYYAKSTAMKGPDWIREYNNYYLYVRDLLQEYADLSRGRLRLLTIDPKRYTDAEDAAIEDGLKKVPFGEDEFFFFGLVAETELGNQKAIPFFTPDRQEFVEYDVSKLIASVARREKKKVGILSSLDVMGRDLSPYMMQMMRMQRREVPQPWQVVNDLREEYELVRVAKDVDSIDKDIDFLLVVHPKDFSEKTLFAVDQFVMHGGKLLVFVDPFSVADQPRRDPQNPMAAYQHQSASDLNKLLKGWGVEMEPGVVAADPDLAIKVGGFDGRVVRMPIYLHLNQESGNPEEVITAKLHSVMMVAAGVLKKVKGVDAKVTPLLTTTKDGAVWKPASRFELMRPDPARITSALKPAGKPMMLACRITGKLKTNFPDGLTVEEKEKDDEQQQKGEDKVKEGKAGEKSGQESKTKTKTIIAVKESPADALVVVFADVDMIADMVAYHQRPFFGMAARGDNISALFNALEFLSGTGDLIAIRSRGHFDRPFEKVLDIERATDKATAEKTQSLQTEIDSFQAKLRDLNAKATKDNVALLESEAAAEQRKLQNELRKARKRLRELKAGKLAKIEALKARLRTHNLLWAPAVVLLIAVVLAIVRYAKALNYAARRT